LIWIKTPQTNKKLASIQSFFKSNFVLIASLQAQFFQLQFNSKTLLKDGTQAWGFCSY